METAADKAKAIVYALLVHVLCIVFALGGLVWWQSSKPVSAAGDPIEAVPSSDAARAGTRRA